MNGMGETNFPKTAARRAELMRKCCISFAFAAVFLVGAVTMFVLAKPETPLWPVWVMAGFGALRLVIGALQYSAAKKVPVDG